VDRYRIPVIIHAPRIIPPRRCDALCSQIDLAPTLLGLMNFSYNSRFFGVDVLASPPNRALVGTDQAFGLYKEGILTTIRPVKKVTAFRVLPDQTQKIIEPRGDLLLEAISYFQSAAYLIGSGALSPCDTRIPTTTPAATAPAP
jgi:phosphoglycerol transferase MdoB-like AlkP superfamily enzyme